MNSNPATAPVRPASRRLWPSLLALALSILPALPSKAAEPAATAAAAPAPKAEGTWKWNFTMPDGTKSSPRAKLKREGNTLTGTSVVGTGTEVAISDGRVEGDQISWSVVREHTGRKVTTRYAGTMSGETLKGTIESDWSGTAQKYPWEAKRASDSPAGIWKWEFSFGRAGGGAGGGGGGGGAGAGAGQGAGAGAGGNPGFQGGGAGAGGGAGPGGRSGRGGGFRFETRMTLKFETNQLTGLVKGRTGTSDTPITDVKFENGKISFKVERVRGNGDVTVTKYSGVLDGDSIKGKSEFEFNGEPRVADWEATRVEE